MSYLSGGGSGASTSVMNRSLFGATPGGGFFPPGSGSPPPSNNAPSPNLVLGQVKTVLNRSSVMSLSDKIYDLNKNLTWALPHLSTKDLDQIFVLLVGDIFGSHAVASSKYGQGPPYFHCSSAPGWNITTLSRHKNWRDFHAVLGFLGSSGTLMSIINTLSHDHNVMYDYPLARLPYHYQQKYQQQKSPQSHVAHHSMFLLSSNPGQDGFQHLPTQQTPTSISLTPFEYYIYHFVGLIAQTNEWYQSSVMENDSLYPMVFEDYLSYFLPIGGAVFKFGSSAGMMSHPHPGSCSSLSRSQQHLFQSPGLSSSKHSLLRSDFAFSATSPASNLSSDGYGNFHPGPALGGGGDNGGRDLSVEARRSHIFVEVVTRFWIQGSMENVGTRGVVQVPSSDVVKLVRMFVKHSHYFFNSFHEAHAELKDNLKQTLFRDFFGKLSFFFEYLFDHWPLDASFRLVLETWLSYIQPWRYRDPAAGQDDRSGGEFQPGKWDQFIQDHIEYYNRLLAKIVMRFFRLDLSSNKNAFMLFRLTKVLNQDGLMANLRNVFALEYSGSKLSGSRVMTPKHGDRSSNNKSFGSSHEAAETFGNIFDEEFKNALNSLVVKVVEAKLSVQMQKNSLIAAESDKRGSGSVLTSIIQFLFSNGPQTNRAELEEFEKTISNLDFVQTKLTSLYNLSPDLDNISSPTEVDSGSPLRPKLHDASTPLSPQMKWNIINKSSKYSPKYNGNPDEMPLRSDESHLLARALYRLSLFVNDRLRIEERHGRGGFVGSLLGLICEPETKYREYERHGESRLVSLPPRIMLRPLASHRNLAYILIALFLGWLLGSGFTLKVLLIVAITLGIKMFFSANSAEEKYSRQEETPAKRGPTITVSGDSFDERKNN